MSRHYLALIPLLSLMAISPSQFKSSAVFRSPANLIEELNDGPYPKFQSRAKKVDLSTLAVDKNISLDKYFAKSQVNSERVVKEKKEFKRDIKVKADLEVQQKMLNEIVMDLVIQEVQLKELIAKKSFEQELSQQLEENSLKENKILLEGMLIDIMDNEISVLTEEMHVSEKKQKEKEVVKVEVKKDEVAKEEVKIDEPKKEEKKEVAKVDDDKYAAYDKRMCAMEDSNKALMEQITKLSTDQSKIIDIMLSMQQQMLQRPAFTPYYAYPQVQQPIYQYQQQSPMGQYSLMPQQQQQQQFAQPQVQSQPLDIWGQPLQTQSYQPIMGVSPQSYSQFDPRYSSEANLLIGQFGGTGQMGFNFGGISSQPQLTMM